MYSLYQWSGFLGCEANQVFIKFPVHLVPHLSELCGAPSNRKNKRTICCTSCSDRACHPCEFLCDFAAWLPEWSFCYNGGIWMAFRPCEFACACASSSIAWTLCCNTDSETADPLCEFWCDREGVKISRMISRNAGTENVSAFVSFAPLVMTSACPRKAEVKGQTGRPMDCQRSHSA